MTQNDFTKTKSKFIIVTILYTIINGLFVYKYGSRQEIISPFILIATYALFSIGFMYLIAREQLKLLKSKVVPFLYWVMVGICGLVFSAIVYKIDGESLNVDRWSALELAVEVILDGEYPYTRIDHVGNMSSNFPALGLLGLPFYLLDDVGFLQVAVFILLSIYLFKGSDKLQGFFVLGLFVLSPAMLWEIVTKSDLASNLMLVVLFIEWWNSRYNRDMVQKPLLLGAIMAFFLLTRGIVIIPLIIFFLRGFLGSSFITKTKVISAAAIAGLLFCMPTFLSVPDWDTLVNYNPLTLQTNKAPLLSYLFLIIPFVIPYLVEKRDYHFYASLIIFAIPFIAFINSIIEIGWNATIFEHKYDISYISMCIPSLLIWVRNYKEAD